MEPTPEPVAAMSVVLATRSGRDGLARSVEHLRRQTRSAELELVIVCDAADPQTIARDVDVFAGHRLVGLPEFATKAVANAAGMRAASAGIVAFAEDHAFVAPGWADALLRRFQDPNVAAVGPCVRNANPASLVSWCDLLLNYGVWMSAAAGGRRETLPGFLCAYRKSALAPYEDRLAAWLEVENEMHRDMHRRGVPLHYEPEAVVAHVNLSRWAPWLAALVAAGRIYAAERARNWGAGRRALYTLAWPAIPFVRWARLLANWPRAVDGLPGRFRLAPTLWVGLVADAFGQALGLAAGAGDASQRMARFEFARAPHLRPAERGLLEPSP